MITLATTPVEPYVPLHLEHFPRQRFLTPSGAEIYPMWSGEGNITYLIVNPKSRESFLIDPDLEILGSYLLTLAMQQLKLVAVIDTHNHAEHATAAPELVQLTGAEYLMHEAAPSHFVTRHFKDNDEIMLAGFKVSFLHTPGHTHEMTTVRLDNHVFTGDSLFIRSCGRTDFPVGDAGKQFDSLQRLKQLPDDTVIHPGHDYSHELSITMGEAKRINPRLQFTDRNEFIALMDEYYKTDEKPEHWEWYVQYNAR